jgi:hypothetical protein
VATVHAWHYGPLLQRTAYLALAAACGAAIYAVGGDGWVTVASLIAPDLPLVYGLAPGLAKGQLHPRAVPYYNASHVFVGPLVPIVASVWLGPTAQVIGLAWAAHIAVDRAVGYGLRTPEGFQGG